MDQDREMRLKTISGTRSTETELITEEGGHTKHFVEQSKRRIPILFKISPVSQTLKVENFFQNFFNYSRFEVGFSGLLA